MNYFVSGGCKNGKSMHAQTLARDMSGKARTAAGENEEMGAADRPLYYIATMIPTDQEDLARIDRHIKEREGWGFTTLEQGRNLMELLDREDVDPNGAFLLDSVTALLSNEMFQPGGVMDWEAGERTARDLVQFAEATGHTVFVSDYLYSEARQFDEYTEAYRKGLALCDRSLAKVCDQVLEVCYGTVKKWK